MVDAILLGKHTELTSEKRKSLVIFGTGDTAIMAADYFEHESHYGVVGFTVDKQYIKEGEFLGRPVVPFEQVVERYSPEYYDLFVAIGYKHLNHLRAEKFREAKKKGYSLACFISPNAYIGRNVTIGENVMIQENNNIQHGCSIGDDVILWAANHIGHKTIIENHVYIASHVVISGFCRIGSYSFIGVNATLAENIKLGRDNLVGAGAYISRDTKDRRVFSTTPTSPCKFSDISQRAREMFEPLRKRDEMD